MKIPFAVRVGLFGAALAAVTLSVFGYLSFRQHADMILETIQRELSATVRNGAVAFSPEDVNASPLDPAALAQSKLEMLAARNTGNKDFRLYRVADGKATFVASASGPVSHLVENPASAEERVQGALADCVNLGRVCVSPIYRDEDGQWITAFAPVFDSNGKIVGMLAADCEAGMYRMAINTTLEQMGYYSIAALAAVAVLGTVAAVRITRRLNLLYRAVLSARDGRFVPLAVKGNDEISTLSRDFNETNLALQGKIEELAQFNRELEARVAARTEELSRSYRESRKRQEDLQREMAVARGVQETILPKSLHREKIDVDVSYIPILEVGGDMGVVLERGQSRYDVAVGDVTGHGVGAALVGNRVHTLLSGLYAATAPLDWMYHRLDYFLSREIAEIGLFLTLITCRFDLEEMQLEVVGGGHIPGLHYHCSTGEITELESRCGIIGAGELFCDPEPVETVKVESGDFLLLSTDGLIEASDPEGNFFGMDRVRSTFTAAIAKAREGEKASTYIVDAAKDFTGGLFQDDVLVVVVEIK